MAFLVAVLLTFVLVHTSVFDCFILFLWIRLVLRFIVFEFTACILCIVVSVVIALPVFLPVLPFGIQAILFQKLSSISAS